MLLNAFLLEPELLLGKAQNRIGIERNGDSLTPFSQEANLAELLSENGYTCAMIGKWHLGPGNEIQNHGFSFLQPSCVCTLLGKFLRKRCSVSSSKIGSSFYHINGCSKTALSFISQYAQEPFFLLLSYRAPHVPLDCPERYLSKFSNKLPVARRQALGMFSAIDVGIGSIQDELCRLNLIEKTCIFFSVTTELP